MSGGCRELEQLGRDTLRLALMTSGALERELGDPEGGDSKRARELTGMLKDLTLLARELRVQDARPVTVRFVGETEDASE